ncbi:hypothetical protein F5Y12DRAFT_737389 [Xylaria sp. FL1777]|nr:hypothetical protein F5Y12DRAFT_737389 [Xylaria sp. FL1777]
MALVAFYCTTDRLPFIANGHPDLAELAKEGFPLFQFPFELPFPSQQLDITGFFHFCKMIQFVADILVRKSVAHDKDIGHKCNKLSLPNLIRLDDNERLCPGDGSPPNTFASLTTKMRGIFAKKLYQYEFLAKAMGYNEDETIESDNIHLRWQSWLIKSIGVVEYQQIYAIEAWVMEDYGAWEFGFQTSFVDEIAEASRIAKLCSRANGGVEPPSVDVKRALTDEKVEITLTYLCNVSSFRKPDFLRMLQSFGLRLYKDLWIATPTKRNRLILSAHKIHESMRMAYGVPRAFNSYRTLLPMDDERMYCWENHIDAERVKLPSTYMERYSKRPRETGRHIDDGIIFLAKTGWWFWDDAHLSRMDVAYHPFFNPNLKWKKKPNLLTLLIKNNPIEEISDDHPYRLASDTIMTHAESYTLPQRVWEDIIAKYQIDPSSHRALLQS